MAQRTRNTQIKFHLDDRMKTKYHLALAATNETAQQILEQAVIEYINRNKNTIQKYVTELQSISSAEN